MEWRWTRWVLFPGMFGLEEKAPSCSDSDDASSIVMLLFLTYKDDAVLFRKKYGVKQTRGKFGLGGAKMVSIWSKMNTRVYYSSMKNENSATNSRSYGLEILEQMRKMAVITPYAEFKFRFVTVTPDENGVKKSYPRLTEEMPRVSVETKYHPSAVDLP
uniref:Uncharacterized protein n=1 Tax=Lactuca sativa TaxID=4236 RepID=A0A9R1WN36_LACSA|nr:hypothetical protein LSAT_V11C100048520 [Lactuca sativa]